MVVCTKAGCPTQAESDYFFLLDGTFELRASCLLGRQKVTNLLQTMLYVPPPW
jgi:hypothetical protein